MNAETIVLEITYTSGHIVEHRPTLHPDVPVGEQVSALRDFLFRRFASPRPFAIEVDRGKGRTAQVLLHPGRIESFALLVAGPAEQIEDGYRPVSRDIRSPDPR